MPDELTPEQAALIAVGRTFDLLGKGAQQAYYGLTGDHKALDQLKYQADEENRLYSPLKSEYPVMSTIGEALPYLVSPAASGVRTALLTGALPGLVEYGTAEEKIARALLGAIGRAAPTGAIKYRKPLLYIGLATKFPFVGGLAARALIKRGFLNMAPNTEKTLTSLGSHSGYALSRAIDD